MGTLSFKILWALNRLIRIIHFHQLNESLILSREKRQHPYLIPLRTLYSIDLKIEFRKTKFIVRYGQLEV
jgi:hypothetical protein